MSAKINDGMTPQQRYYEKNKEKIRVKRRKEWVAKQRKRIELRRQSIFYDPSANCWGNPSELEADSFKTKVRYLQTLNGSEVTAREDAMILHFLLYSVFWYYGVGYRQKDRGLGMEGARYQGTWRAAHIQKYMGRLNKNITSRYIGIVANCVGLYNGTTNFGYMGGKGRGMYGPLRSKDAKLSDADKKFHPMPFYCGEYCGVTGKVAKDSEIEERALKHLNIVRRMHGAEIITKEMMAEAKEKLEDVVSNRTQWMIDSGNLMVTEEQCDEKIAELEKEESKSIMDVI